MRDQSLLLGPSKNHPQVTEFGVDGPVLNGVTTTCVDVGAAVGNRNSMSLHWPKPMA